jgi:hypothetical protein
MKIKPFPNQATATTISALSSALARTARFVVSRSGTGGGSNPDLLNAIQRGMNPDSFTNQPLTANPSSACTTACTNEAEITNAGSVEALAAMLLRLPEGDKARLATLLVAPKPQQTEEKEQ